MLTVIESPEVSAKIDAESRIYERLEEAFDALKWWLARNYDQGELIDDYHWLYKQSGDRYLNIPALVALYTFNRNYVEIISILIRIPTL
jgi:hypothetical protein